MRDFAVCWEHFSEFPFCELLLILDSLDSWILDSFFGSISPVANVYPLRVPLMFSGDG